jgi:hypothetical protein
MTANTNSMLRRRQIRRGTGNLPQKIAKNSGPRRIGIIELRSGQLALPLLSLSHQNGRGKRPLLDTRPCEGSSAIDVQPGTKAAVNRIHSKTLRGSGMKFALLRAGLRDDFGQINPVTVDDFAGDGIGPLPVRNSAVRQDHTLGVHIGRVHGQQGAVGAQFS